MWLGGERSGERVRAALCGALRAVAGLGVCGALACAVDNRGTDVVDGDDPAANAGSAGADAEGPAGSGLGGAGAADPAGNGGAGTSAAGAQGAGAEAAVGTVGAAGGSVSPVAMGAGGAAGTGVSGASAGGASAGAGAVPSNGVPVVCGEQLLANGDFDAGDDGGWNVAYDARSALVSRDDPALAGTGVAPQSGDYLVWLGGVRSTDYGLKYTTRISQPVTIPENALSVTFTGYVWVTQPEPGLPLIDWAVLELLDPANMNEQDYSGQWQVALWNESNVTQGWVPFEAERTIEIASLRGRTLMLVGDSRPDGNGTLNVWLDSLRLQARCE